MNFKKRIAPVALAIVLGTATAGTATASSEIIVDEYIDIPALQEEIVTVQPEDDGEQEDEEEDECKGEDQPILDGCLKW